MSGKDSQNGIDRKNLFIDTYHNEYVDTSKLDMKSLSIEKLENLLYSIAHAHDLIGKQVQDLSSGNIIITY